VCAFHDHLTTNESWCIHCVLTTPKEALYRIEIWHCSDMLLSSKINYISKTNVPDHVLYRGADKSIAQPD